MEGGRGVGEESLTRFRVNELNIYFLPILHIEIT